MALEGIASMRRSHLTEGENQLDSDAGTGDVKHVLQMLHRRTVHGASIRRTLAIWLIVLFSISSFSALIAAPAEKAATSTTEVSAGVQGFLAGDVTLETSPALQIVGQETTFFANATSDIPGATLIITIYYDYYNLDLSQNTEGGFTVNTTSNPGQVVQKHSYNGVGNFTDSTPNPFHWVFLFVDDGSTNYSMSMKVYTNEAPWLYWADAPIYPTPGASGWFYEEYLFFIDNNSDMVNVTWDWGDGTSSSQELQGLPLSLGGVTTSSNHSWKNDTIRIPGRSEYYVNFTMNITLSDGVNPTVVFAVNVSIFFPNNLPPDAKGLQASPLSVSPFDPVSFNATASDYEGEALTWTFDYGDGSIEVFHTGTTSSNGNATQNTTHEFAAPGNYTVMVYVSDSVPPYQTGDHNVSLTAIIHVIQNHAPYISGNITATPSQNPMINATVGYVNVTFQIDAWDIDNDGLTATWDLGGGDTRTNSTASGSLVIFRQTRQFNDTGDFNVTVMITDGRPGHELLRNLTIHVTSNNRPPSANLVFKYFQGDFGTPNENINFTLVVTDLEHDVIEVTWDFGDGSPVQHFNLASYIGDNTTLVVSHRYADQRKYNMTINITDNKIGYLNHSIVVKQPVVIFIPQQKKVVTWDWWDYTTLSLVAMIPALLGVRMVLLGRRRKRLEDQGLSLDEAKLRKELHLDRSQPHETPSEPSPDAQDQMTKEEEL